MGQQTWLCSYFVFNFWGAKIKAFRSYKIVLIKKKKYGCYVQFILWRGSDIRFDIRFKYETLEKIGYVVFYTVFN